MAETNSYYNGGAQNISDTYASALWVVDHLFTLASLGASGANLHGGGDSDGYTPIANNGPAVVGTRPIFDGLVFFTLAGQGTLEEVSLSSTGLNVSGYAVRSASGGLSVVINNKDASSTLNVTISAGQRLASAALTMLGNTGAALTATAGTVIQGASIATNGTFTPLADFTLEVSDQQTACSVPPLSAALVRLA